MKQAKGILKWIMDFYEIDMVTIYPTIYYREPHDALDWVYTNHEKIHLVQQKELLIVGFYILYLLSYIFNLFLYWDIDKAYKNIIFEREAFNNEKDKEYLDTRTPYKIFRKE